MYAVCILSVFLFVRNKFTVVVVEVQIRVASLDDSITKYIRVLNDIWR